jgi:hypothetical protein
LYSVLTNFRQYVTYVLPMNMVSGDTYEKDQNLEGHG